MGTENCSNRRSKCFPYELLHAFCYIANYYCYMLSLRSYREEPNYLDKRHYSCKIVKIRYNRFRLIFHLLTRARTYMNLLASILHLLHLLITGIGNVYLSPTMSGEWRLKHCLSVADIRKLGSLSTFQRTICSFLVSRRSSPLATKATEPPPKFNLGGRDR